MVGMAGFEPTTTSPPSEVCYQAALHPKKLDKFYPITINPITINNSVRQSVCFLGKI